MTSRCLFFHLTGPMAGWGGEGAIGDIRKSDTHPSKSAIVGILAASLGIDRSDTELQTCLFNDYDYVVTSKEPVKKISDFHTIQTGSTDSIRSKSPVEEYCRRFELKSKYPVEIVSRREYICNGFYSVFVISKDGCRFSLEEIKDALEHPHYIPYLGRKSCALSFPMCPGITDCGCLYDTICIESMKPFEKFQFPESDFPADKNPRIFAAFLADKDLRIFATFPMDKEKNYSVVKRRDDMADRRNWTFTERNEYVYKGE